MISDDTEYKMLSFTKLMLIAEQYSPKQPYDGPVHLIKAIKSFQVKLMCLIKLYHVIYYFVHKPHDINNFAFIRVSKTSAIS